MSEWSAYEGWGVCERRCTVHGRPSRQCSVAGKVRQRSSPIYGVRRGMETQPRKNVIRHVTAETKRVAPDVIAAVKEGPRSTAGSSPAALPVQTIPVTGDLLAEFARLRAAGKEILAYERTDSEADRLAGVWWRVEVTDARPKVAKQAELGL